ncbi:hypothetical protein CPC08DRAFT_774971 [Agrocybe pediades]|nr:hypothetical protein CPC08DRAFT_774971 [Agrocybe pediades]
MEKEMGTKSLRTVLVYEEIKTEKCIRWDSQTNYFLEVCREHASKTSMELINEGDMKKLFRNIDEDKVHYHAGEAILGALGILGGIIAFNPNVLVWTLETVNVGLAKNLLGYFRPQSTAPTP